MMTTLHRALLAFVVLLLTSCSYKLASYFRPPAAGPLVYDGFYTKSPTDSLYRQIENTFGAVSPNNTVHDTTEVVFRSVEYRGAKVYYTISIRDAARGDATINNFHFLFASTILRHDSLWVVPMYRQQDLRDIVATDYWTFIPKRIRKQDTVLIENGKKTMVLHSFRRTRLSLNDRQLRNCLRFTLLSKWPDTTYPGTVWLHRELGMVKWIRSTGRVDVRRL